MRAELGCLFLLGCGGLVDGTYAGHPMFEIEGSVVLLSDNGPVDWPEGELRAALFWANDDGAVVSEQDVHTSTSFPAQFLMRVYEPPPAAARLTPAWSDGVEVAVATVLLYIDADGNGVHNNGEQLVGSSADMAVLWSSEALGGDATDAVADEAREEGAINQIQPGFQRVLLWDYCKRFPVDRLGILVPDKEDPTTLYAGDAFWLGMADWDCDGSYNEWDAYCPEEHELDWLCEVRDDFEGDPYMEYCLRECDEVG